MGLRNGKVKLLTKKVNWIFVAKAQSENDQ